MIGLSFSLLSWNRQGNVADAILADLGKFQTAEPIWREDVTGGSIQALAGTTAAFALTRVL
jgi:hypothetical protein